MYLADHLNPLQGLKPEEGYYRLPAVLADHLNPLQGLKHQNRSQRNAALRSRRSSESLTGTETQ